MSPRDPRVRVETQTRGAITSNRFELVSVAAALAPSPEHDGEMMLFLEATIKGKDGQRAEIALGFFELDPYIVAADILGMADHLLRRVAIEEGLDKREQEQALARARRTAKIARRNLVQAAEASHGTTCDFCPRSARVIVEGKRYCKRCAEEHGVRPHGKIGDERT